LPQIINVQAQYTVVFDSFNCQKFSFIDLLHKFPRFSSFISDFLYLVIEESAFGDFDCISERFPVFEVS